MAGKGAFTPMKHSKAGTPWWTPDRHNDRRPGLLLRNKIKQNLRAWFDEQGFVEVDTSCLQHSPGNETHLHALQTTRERPDLTRDTLYLHTSPEIACKKLLAAGETKIFSFAPVFRNREHGALHHPEFTMLEWYRVGAPLETLMADCEQILNVSCKTVGRQEWTWQNQTCEVLQAPVTVSIRDTFLAHLGFDLADSLATGTPDRDTLASQVKAAGLSVQDDETWGDLFSRSLISIEPSIWSSPPVQPKAGANQRPVFLTDYPACEAPLARASDNHAGFAKRFELFVNGVELANGYDELNDTALLQHRLEQEMAEKRRIYGESYPIDPDFLQAVGKMPNASGCALGFDRLAMLAVGADRIDQVLWTPVPQAT